MGTVTYPDEKVAKFISLNFIPVQIQVSNAELMQKYAVKWTPTILVLDADGREQFRSVGFFGPDELIAALMVGKGHWYLATAQFPEAQGMFEEVQRVYPQSEAAAEAIFFNGVNLYKMTHDPKKLRECYELLAAKFPQSSWTKQASHYRLINQ
jgi:hypothetical protein